MTKDAREWVIRGAKIGALSLSFTGFASGIGICLALEHPVPPIFTTEVGLFLGATLGALVGWVCVNPTARRVLLGVLLGALFGVVAGLVSGSPVPATIAASACVGAFLGLQATPRASEAEEHWTQLKTSP